jgi:hypothetical protein
VSCCALRAGASLAFAYNSVCDIATVSSYNVLHDHTLLYSLHTSRPTYLCQALVTQRRALLRQMSRSSTRGMCNRTHTDNTCAISTCLLSYYCSCTQHYSTFLAVVPAALELQLSLCLLQLLMIVCHRVSRLLQVLELHQADVIHSIATSLPRHHSLQQQQQQQHQSRQRHRATQRSCCCC